jgi:cytochrome b pre-mRNA-processing protein 3
MRKWFQARAESRRIGRDVYDAIVAQARTPGFYRELQVPDTVEGRFELIVLHIALVLNRLVREGAAGQQVAQSLTESFVADMDDTLREMGIGDLGVPRRVKKAAAALYERGQAYASGLSARQAAPDPLAAALSEHVYAGPCAGLALEQLAGYVRDARALLDQQPASSVFAGQIAFPPVPGTDASRPTQVAGGGP